MTRASSIPAAISEIRRWSSPERPLPSVASIGMQPLGNKANHQGNPQGFWEAEASAVNMIGLVTVPPFFASSADSVVVFRLRQVAEGME